MDPVDIVVIGGGPAGLAAAEAAVRQGARVLVAEQKPSLGRKFLMAGKSGLNLTKAEDPASFRGRIAHGPAVGAALAAVTPQDVTAWAEGLGQPLFTGSSGRVFPVAMKASPLLRAWSVRLTGAGVMIRTRWRWTGPDLQFETPDGPRSVTARAVVLACGGGSWARLGADGAWTTQLERLGIPVAPFQPSNSGFRRAWSEPMSRFVGTPVKGIAAHVGSVRARGDFVITQSGIEGGAIYEVSAVLRDRPGALMIDLLPDLDLPAVHARLSRPRGKASMATHLRKTLRLTGVKAALLREGGPLPTGEALAQRIKSLPLPCLGPMPLDQAISTAGGVAESGLDAELQLVARPGWFCAGEMIDWDAPTGGYLLTTCLATGWAAGQAAARWAGGEASGTR